MAWAEKYASSAGAGDNNGTSEAHAWDLATAIANAAAGDRVNFKGNCTTGGAVTFNNANGTTLLPIWWRAYVTNIGDLDGTTTCVTFTCETNLVTFSGTYQIFTNFKFTSTRTAGGGVTIGTNHSQYFDHCQFINTGANANSYCCNVGVAAVLTRCYFSAAVNATNAVTGSGGGSLFGCVLTGGGTNTLNTSGTFIVMFSIFFAGNIGILHASTSGGMYMFNTFYSITADCIKITTVPGVTSVRMIMGNIFANAVYGINQASGADTANVPRFHNMSYALSTGMETGFADFPSFGNVAEATDPFVSTTSSNADFLKLVTGCAGKAVGFPGLFENLATQTYTDIGALQRQEAVSGNVKTIQGVSVSGIDAIGA